MIKIESSVQPGLTLAVIIFPDGIRESRTDLVEDHHMLQVAALRFPGPRRFRAHKHIPKKIHTEATTQEAWVVVKGLVRVSVFDLDDKPVEPTEMRLGPGSCVIMLAGGHAYESLIDDTVVYEFKSGPYLGVEYDKVWIEEESTAHMKTNE